MGVARFQTRSRSIQGIGLLLVLAGTAPPAGPTPNPVRSGAVGVARAAARSQRVLTLPAHTSGLRPTATARSEVVDPRVAAAVAHPARPLAALTSPDSGEHCLESLDAAGLTDFFSKPIGTFEGADYQRAIRLPDDRVLWTFQDAWISGVLVHNAGMVQSGRCFTLLNSGTHSWLLDDLTTPMHKWQWILGGAATAGGTRIELFVVEMIETGNTYLSRTRPGPLRRVVIDASTFAIIDVVDEPATGGDLFGWSVTSDADYTYLYSYCYQQFGYDTLLGFGECSVDVKLSRIPLGDFDAQREYWGGTAWSVDPTHAVPVVDGAFVFSGNNPAQIQFDGSNFVLVEKRDDWFGTTVEFGTAGKPQGPFRHVMSISEPLTCDRTRCNTYFASWIPWKAGGDHIWSISHNRWDGSETYSHLADYRPTFDSIAL